MPLPRRVPVPSRVESFTMPPPMGGLNTVTAGLNLPAEDCSSVVNMMASEQGLRTRLGYKEWAVGLTGAVSKEVRSMLPFTGSSLASNKLFAVTDRGIYNVTSGGSSSPLVATFTSTSGLSGYGVSCVVVTAGGHFLLYADEVNGLWRYTENGGTWTKVTLGNGAGQISGIEPGRIAFVTVFKGRVWLVERDTANAWILPVGQVSGAASLFPLAAVFKAGGTLVGLWSWTYDGGSGLDDSLVAVSTGGDVLVYQGTNPTDAGSFGLKGTWYVGQPPRGRRIANPTGGELLLLSRQGLVPLSKLVVGAVTSAEYASAKVANLLNRLLVAKGNKQGWAVVQSPEDNTLLVLQPRGGDGVAVQLARSLTVPSWFLYAGVPMLSATAWSAQLYFGSEDGRVFIHTGAVDEQRLSPSILFQPIRFSLLSGFSTLGRPVFKQVQLTSPLFIGEGSTPAFSSRARYRMDTSIPPVPAFTPEVGDLWGTALWGLALWASGSQVATPVQGSSGLGKTVAIALAGQATARATLVGIDVAYTSGGWL